MENSRVDASSDTNESLPLSSDTNLQSGGQNLPTPASESRHIPSLQQISYMDRGSDWMTARALHDERIFFENLQNSRSSRLFQQNQTATQLVPIPSEQGTAAVGSESALLQVPSPAMGNPLHSGVVASSNSNASPRLSSDTNPQSGGQNRLSPASESRHIPSLNRLSYMDRDNDWMMERALHAARSSFEDFIQSLTDTNLVPLPSEQGNAAVGSESGLVHVPSPAMGNPPHNRGTGPNQCPGCANCRRGTQRNQPSPAMGNPPHNQRTGPNPCPGCVNCNGGTERNQRNDYRCIYCNHLLVGGDCPNMHCYEPPGFLFEDRRHVQLQAALHRLPAKNSTKRDHQFTGAPGSGRQQRAFLYLLLGLEPIKS